MKHWSYAKEEIMLNVEDPLFHIVHSISYLEERCVIYNASVNAYIEVLRIKRLHE